jgi:hypothetical protein
MSSFMNVVFYADDPNARATFWAAELGYPPPDAEDLVAFVADQGVTPEMVATRSVAATELGRFPRALLADARPRGQRVLPAVTVTQQTPGA